MSSRGYYTVMEELDSDEDPEQEWLLAYGDSHSSRPFEVAHLGLQCTVGRGRHNVGTVVLRLDGEPGHARSRLISSTCYPLYQRTRADLEGVRRDLRSYPSAWRVYSEGTGFSLCGDAGGATISGRSVPMLHLHATAGALCPLVLAYHVLSRALAAPLTRSHPQIYVHMRVANRSDLRMRVPGFNTPAALAQLTERFNDTTDGEEEEESGTTSRSD